MVKRKVMFETAEDAYDDEEPLPSRSKLRKQRKNYQARLDALTAQFTQWPEERVEQFELGDELRDELRVLRGQKKGSALARQRRRVSFLLREFDIDELEKRVQRADQKRR